MILDINIKAENSIEIRNSLAEGYIMGSLRVFDKIDAPRLKGSSSFERGSILKFRDNEFEVTDSSFQFMGRNPIDPDLSIRAETRLNSYDINLLFQRRSGNQQINVSSQPPLPEDQIISMLALGQLPGQFNPDPTQQQLQQQQLQQNQQQNSQANSFQIGTSLLSNNPLGKEIKNRLGVDIQFSSSFDDQNNVAVPRVSLRWPISKKLDLSVSQTAGNVSQSEGRMTYEINNQFSTIFRVTNREQDITEGNTTDNDQSNPFGVDLEYRVEFD